MGLEAKCEARVLGRWQEGLARLEEKEIVFRGDVRVRAPLDLLKDVRVKDGVLAFRFGGEELALRLGAQAAKWAERILNPPSRLDKLGVQPGQRVCVVGLEDPAFLKELTLRGAVVTSNRTVEGADMVFFACPSRSGLRRLPALARAVIAMMRGSLLTWSAIGQHMPPDEWVKADLETLLAPYRMSRAAQPARARHAPRKKPPAAAKAALARRRAAS